MSPGTPVEVHCGESHLFGTVRVFSFLSVPTDSELLPSEPRTGEEGAVLGEGHCGDEHRWA